MLKKLAEKLRAAQSVVLTTHRHADGDGLGAQLALCLGLRKLGKSARILNVDLPSAKYDFLKLNQYVDVFESEATRLPATDFALILDTNDGRLVEPLFTHLTKTCKEVIFIDHHPILEQGPAPTPGSVIDTEAASTGQMSFELLRLLGVEFDAEIARALYTSLVFDTQLFRYVKSLPASHLMAAELLKYERSPEQVHHHLFATYTVEKMDLLSSALKNVEYYDHNQVAILKVKADDFRSRGLSLDDSGDLIDLVMNITTVEVAALIREDAANRFKLSLRSKGRVEVLAIAEDFGGGGHVYASGASLEGPTEIISARVTEAVRKLLVPSRTPRSKS